MPVSENLHARIGQLLPEERSEFERWLLSRSRSAAGDNVIEPRRAEGPSPLSYTQSRLWFLQQLDPDGTGYNILSAYDLRGELDIAALQRSLDEMVRRHEILRTTIQSSDELPVQVVQPASGLHVPVADLTHISDHEVEAVTKHHAGKLSVLPFDLASDNLLRVQILRFSPLHHVLLLIFHHMAMDSSSLRIWWQELDALYEAYSCDSPSPLDEPSIQYTDYADWQRRRVSGDRYEELVRYWRGKLEDAPRYDIQTDFARDSVPSYAGQRHEFLIPQAYRTALSSLAQQSHASTFMAFLAAFYVLLSRYTGGQDITVGAPYVNRGHPQIQSLIGFFANTLALRTDMSGNPTFRELLERVRGTALDAFEHQELPFEQLVAELQPERILNQSPLFQIIFQLNDTPKPVLKLGNINVSELENSTPQVRFDLEVGLREESGVLVGRIAYNRALFSESTMRQFADRYLALLAAISANPDAQIDDLSILSEAEREQLVAAGDAKIAPLPDPATVHRYLEEQAVRIPDKMAIGAESAAVTYSELNCRANQIAHTLHARGIGQGDLVGLCLDRSIDLVAAIFGVLKAGAAYMPMDPDYPDERLRIMMAESDMGLLIVQDGAAKRLAAEGRSALNLDRDRHLIEEASTENIGLSVTAHDRLYILFTSGSTGHPKAVAMPHQALVNLVEWQRHHPDIGGDAHTLQFADSGFDVAAQEIFATVATGGTLRLVSAETRRNPEELLDFVDKMQVQRLYLPYVALRTLAAAAQRSQYAPACIEDIICAGEQLRLSGEIRWLIKESGARLHNHYGPTETHVVTAHSLTGNPDTWPVAAPIGRPIDNVSLYLLDRHDNPVPAGIAGEITVAGPCLANGYSNDSSLTEARFTPAPPALRRNVRLYRTGDIGRYLADGTLVYLGRRDRQIKVRGFRVEPAEIEAALRACSGIDDAVISLHGEHEAALLIAYVVKSGSSITDEELRAELRSMLPGHMIPSRYIPVEHIPLTSSGKIDRAKLPPLPQHALSTTQATVGQQIIIDIWEALLRVAPISRHDDFFELGGHSLLATSVLSRLKEQGATELSLRSLFTYRTPTELARHIDSREESEEDDDVEWSEMFI